MKIILKKAVRNLRPLQKILEKKREKRKIMVTDLLLIIQKLKPSI